jgi:hypothetical protein
VLRLTRMHKIVAHIRTAENGTDGDAARTNRGDRSIAGNAQTLPGQYREVRQALFDPQDSSPQPFAESQSTPRGTKHTPGECRRLRTTALAL